MSKRWGIVGVTAIAVLIAAGAIASSLELRSPLATSPAAQAEEAREIPIYVARQPRNEEEPSIGDVCSLSRLGAEPVSQIISPRPQIVIEDEHGTTIASEVLDHTWLDASDADMMGDWAVDPSDDGDPRVVCGALATASVPESGFYTVYLDGEYVRVYSSNDLASDELPGISIPHYSQ